ncbi:MAG: BMP family ABC transporter substrate-binding protein, partial [Clostridia bacterium]|nr:BMP family ABC transporter substrate-binding protein [Clostridia bacterium]
DISKAVLEGTFTAGTHLYDLSNGGVDIAPTRDLLPEEVITAVEAAKADIIAGKVTVPSSVEELGEGLFTLGE